MTAKVNAEQCTGCEACVQSCPLEAIQVADGLAKVDESTCGDCGACVDACPTGAISVD
jgi:ferredoxin